MAELLTRERVIWHEAAHLTVALRLGVPVDSAEAGDSSGCVKLAGPHRDVVLVAIAGCVGEALHFGTESVPLTDDATLLATVPREQQQALANIASVILQGPARQRWGELAELLRHKPRLTAQDLRP